jgi:hypothetical protein
VKASKINILPNVVLRYRPVVGSGALAGRGYMGQLAKLSETPRREVAWARKRRKVVVAIPVQIRAGGT